MTDPPYTGPKMEARKSSDSYVALVPRELEFDDLDKEARVYGSRWVEVEDTDGNLRIEEVPLTWKEGTSPCFVLEITSKETADYDRKVKPAIYRKAKVPEIFQDQVVPGGRDAEAWCDRSSPAAHSSGGIKAGGVPPRLGRRTRICGKDC